MTECKSIEKILMIFILTILSTITASAMPTISVNAPEQIAPEQEFTVKIHINTPEDEVYAAQFDLNYDTSLLEAMTVNQGDLLAADTTTIIGAKNILGSNGMVQYGESRAVVKTGILGSGSLATIIFKAKTKTQNNVKLTLNNVILIDSELKEIPVDIQNAAVNIKTPDITKRRNAENTAAIAVTAIVLETGDVNTDGKINFLDAATLALSWGTNDRYADLNQDGNVDMQDMNILTNILNNK
jgi:hypothetical protein